MFNIFSNIFHFKFVASLKIYKICAPKISKYFNLLDVMSTFPNIFINLMTILYCEYSAHKCHKIMNFKEHVTHPLLTFSFSVVLLKSDLHFAAKVRRCFCFVDRKRRRKKERNGEYVLLFTHFVSFFRFQVGSRNLHTDDEVEREAPGDFDGLCEVYGMAARETLLLSPLLMHIQKLHHQWESREITKISEDSYPICVDKLQSRELMSIR